jgi:serine phosphatase RsbU (regulator of sigma subunit)
LKIPDFGEVLWALHNQDPTAVMDSISGLAQAAGAVDVVIYLVDFEQAVLTPIPGRGAHVDLPGVEAVPGSPAGLAFREQRLVSEPRPEGVRVWVPILEASDCTGVLALTVDVELDDETRASCAELGMLAGCAISLASRQTDLYNLVRRRKAMSLPASLQWDLLPPLLVRTPEVTSAAVLEPAYDVGGDCFDHAVNGLNLDVAIMDAMGHGLSSSVTSSLAIGTYRHDRREGQSLATIHRRLDQVISRQMGGDIFVTGQVARLATQTGRFTWTNAGHPPPLLVRDGAVLRPLACRPSLPWGLGGELEEEATETLEAGDAVLFYTDGVIDGRAPDGRPFGLERLVDLVETAAKASTPTSEILRQLIGEVLTYQDRRLRDDASLVWVYWRGPT